VAQRPAAALLRERHYGYDPRLLAYFQSEALFVGSRRIVPALLQKRAGGGPGQAQRHLRGGVGRETVVIGGAEQAAAAQRVAGRARAVDVHFRAAQVAARVYQSETAVAHALPQSPEPVGEHERPGKLRPESVGLPVVGVVEVEIVIDVQLRAVVDVAHHRGRR